MSDTVDYLHDVFARFGGIVARRMFSGHGIYHDGLMFAIVVDDTLYLKADSENLPHFQRLGLPQFEYDRKSGGKVGLSYYQAPAEIMDDPDCAAVWARRAFEAALRSRRPRRGNKK